MWPCHCLSVPIITRQDCKDRSQQCIDCQNDTSESAIKPAVANGVRAIVNVRVQGLARFSAKAARFSDLSVESKTTTGTRLPCFIKFRSATAWWARSCRAMLRRSDRQHRWVQIIGFKVWIQIARASGTGAWKLCLQKRIKNGAAIDLGPHQTLLQRRIISSVQPHPATLHPSISSSSLIQPPGEH